MTGEAQPARQVARWRPPVAVVVVIFAVVLAQVAATAAVLAILLLLPFAPERAPQGA
jgi:antibiotic biosynthesis monooxygenase (ABM) superfamily enzyme